MLDKACNTEWKMWPSLHFTLMAFQLATLTRIPLLTLEHPYYYPYISCTKLFKQTLISLDHLCFTHNVRHYLAYLVMMDVHMYYGKLVTLSMISK